MLKKTLLLVAAVLIYTNTAFADTEDHRMNGFWILEKTDVYGVEPDDPKLAELYKRFDGMAFEAEIVTDFFYNGISVEAEGGIVYFNNGCGYYPEVQVLTESDFFARCLSEASFKPWFENTFNIELSDPLSIWNLIDCEPLGMSILVSPEKLVLMAEGKIYGAFKKVGLKEYLAVSGLDSPEGFTYSIMMGMVEQYWHENKTLAEAYAWLLEKYPTETKPLKKTLPATDISYKYSEGENTGVVHISYEYKNANYLGVELFYGISFVYLDFSIIDDNWALVRISHYAD